jgi:hypothetical protein
VRGFDRRWHDRQHDAIRECGSGAGVCEGYLDGLKKCGRDTSDGGEIGLVLEQRMVDANGEPVVRHQHRVCGASVYAEADVAAEVEPRNPELAADVGTAVGGEFTPKHKSEDFCSGIRGQELYVGVATGYVQRVKLREQFDEAGSASANLAVENADVLIRITSEQLGVVRVEVIA